MRALGCGHETPIVLRVQLCDDCLMPVAPKLRADGEPLVGFPDGTNVPKAQASKVRWLRCS